MATASGRAGQVLAKPPFRRLNVHGRVCFESTQSLIWHIRTYKPSGLGKWFPIIVQISVDIKVANIELGFSASSAYLMAIPFLLQGMTYVYFGQAYHNH